jgi:hypothetical protein
MWIDKPHRCNVPLIAHGGVAKVGAWYECDHCHKEWQVQARVIHPEVESLFLLTYIRHEGGITLTRSWQEIM